MTSELETNWHFSLSPFPSLWHLVTPMVVVMRIDASSMRLMGLHLCIIIAVATSSLRVSLLCDRLTVSLSAQRAFRCVNFYRFAVNVS